MKKDNSGNLKSVEYRSLTIKKSTISTTRMEFGQGKLSIEKQQVKYYDNGGNFVIAVAIFGLVVVELMVVNYKPVVSVVNEIDSVLSYPVLEYF